MPDLQNSVFISYRRKPASYIARAIFMDLKMHGYDVFMDVESIDEGEFETIIQNQIKARPYFLIILTKGTVARFDEPKDLMRSEIELAIEEKRKIIPLFIDEFKFNKTTKRYFTGKLDYVLKRQGVTIHHDDFDADLEKLRTRYLIAQAIVTTEPAPLSEQPEVERIIEEAAAQPTPTINELLAEAYFNRALARDDKEYEGKIADYGEAIRLNPQYVEAYNNRGIARQNKGDIDVAIADYSEAIRLNPQFSLAYYNRGIAHYKKDELDAAIANYSEAMQLDPRYVEAYSNRGLARDRKGDYNGAIADCSEAIRIDPQDSTAYNNRGLALYHKGDFGDAIADCNEAIRIEPQEAITYVTRGVTYFAISKLHQALADFREANRLRPDLDNALAGLAITQFELGKKDEAKQSWQSLLAKDQHYRDADWAGRELEWRPELVEAARKLIAEL